MRWIVAGDGGVVPWYAPSRGSADAVVTVRMPDGSDLTTSGVGAREAVDTTLAEGAPAGADTLRLSASLTLRERGTYRLGGNRSEMVRVKTWDGVNVQLEHALRHPHAALADFESTLFEYTLPAGQDPGDNWRAFFAWSGGPAHPVRFGVALHGFDNPLTPPLLWGYDATLPNRHPFTDWDAVCDRAFQAVVSRVSARGVPIWDYLDSEQLLDACAFMAWRDAEIPSGAEFADLRAALAVRIEEEIEAYCSCVGADVDRSGAIATDEKRGRTGRGTFSRKPA